MNGFRPSIGAIPPVVKNLLIINVIFFLGDSLLGNFLGEDPTRLLGLYFFKSQYFEPWQFVTHLFMHADITHIFGNMFALFMFGRILEQVWGPKRFLIYYFACGLGAAAFHTLVLWINFNSMESALMAFKNTPDPALLANFVADNIPHAQQWVYELIDRWADNPDSVDLIRQGSELFERVVYESVNVPTVGASGAVFGLLLAFGMLFPNSEIMLLFLPVPIKAKYFVAFYGIFELFLAVKNSAGDNVAHFAHLGGMIFGFILIKYWNKSRNKFY